MTPLYQIRDWDRHFENNRSRGREHLDWLPIPNKMDGDGYTQLVLHKNGAAHFGAWIAIAEIGSRCHPRGTLVREDGTPHTPESLSRLSRLPAQVFAEVLPRLASKELGWLQVIANLEISDSCSVVPDEGTRVPDDGTTVSLNRIEGKGIEEKESLPTGERKARPLSNGEVQDYWLEAGLQGDPEDFFDFWQSRGWRDKAGPIRDWRARARTWSRREGKGGGGPREVNPDVRVGRGTAPELDPDTAKLRELEDKYRYDPDRQNKVSTEFREWQQERQTA